jgi:hypothetical protein
MEDACRKACEEIKACQQACPPSTDRGAKSTSVPCALQCGRR